MEKRVLVLSGLVIICSIFLLNDDFRNPITGMAADQGGGDCPCADGTPASTCVDGDLPWYCEETDGECAIHVACTICGCPDSSPYCWEGTGVTGLGACSSTPQATCGDGRCSSGETETSCPADCTSATDGGDSNGGSDARGCNDGTNHGQCSTIKPLYCTDGSLIDRCSTCGCNASYYCEGEVCIKNESITDVAGTETASEEEEEEYVYAVSPKSCGDVGGVCSNKCAEGYFYYGNTNFDKRCETSYPDITFDLICCVSKDLTIVVSSDEENTSEELETLEQNLVDQLQIVNDGEETTQPEFSPEDTSLVGLSETLLSPRYAVNILWVIFGITVFVVVITYYLHNNLIKKRIYKKK